MSGTITGEQARRICDEIDADLAGLTQLLDNAWDVEDEDTIERDLDAVRARIAWLAREVEGLCGE